MYSKILRHKGRKTRKIQKIPDIIVGDRIRGPETKALG